MDETDYLLSSPANAARLRLSTSEFILSDYLDSPEMIAAFVDACLEEGLREDEGLGG